MLCFSARDECHLPPEISMPHDGFHFSPVSENEPLDKSVYGTTWVNEAFVRSHRRVAGEILPAESGADSPTSRTSTWCRRGAAISIV